MTDSENTYTQTHIQTYESFKSVLSNSALKNVSAKFLNTDFQNNNQRESLWVSD